MSEYVDRSGGFVHIPSPNLANMKLPTLFLVVFLCALVRSEEELQIETSFKPDTCERVTQSGDMVSMHYTGTLASDGSKFDSRYE